MNEQSEIPVDTFKKDNRSRVKYDPDTVRTLFKDTIAVNDLLDKEQRAHFDQTLQATDRISTDLAVSERSYTGSWYHQHGEPTCLPWSVVNGTLAVSVTPDLRFTLDLLNHAGNIQSSEKAGMNYQKACEILKQYPHSGIRIYPLPKEQNLDKIHQPPDEDFSKFFDIIDDSRTSAQIAADSLTLSKRDNTLVVWANGALIKEIVDSGDILLTGVTIKKYANDKKGGVHAICVSGYKVSEQGTVDVQVLDSARGKLWMSLEHLSSCIIPLTAFRLTKDVKH